MEAEKLTTYDKSYSTDSPPVTVLDDVAATHADRGLPVAERAPSYVTLRPRRTRVPGGVAIALGIVILLVTLGLMAVSTLFVAVIPLALVPLIPYLLDRRPFVSVSAVRTGDVTVVRAYGKVGDEARQALDTQLGSLPRPSSAVIGSDATLPVPDGPPEPSPEAEPQ